MSFLDGSSQSALLDCSEGDMKAGAWGGTDLLDPGGDAADFDISSFFSQLAASTAGVEAAHGSDGLCGPAEDVSSVPLSVPEEVHTSAAADDVTEAVGDVTVADVSLSTLLGEHAELQEALLAASEPPPPPPTSRGKTFVVVTKQHHHDHDDPPPDDPPPDVPAPPPRRPRGRPKHLTTPPYGRPPTAPLSAYNIFFKEQYALLKTRWRALNRSRAVPRLSKLWGKMTAEEKRVYQRRAEEAKAEYRAQLAQYRQRARLWRKQQAGGATTHTATETATVAATVGSTQATVTAGTQAATQAATVVRGMETEAATVDATDITFVSEVANCDTNPKTVAEIMRPDVISAGRNIISAGTGAISAETGILRTRTDVLPLRMDEDDAEDEEELRTARSAAVEDSDEEVHSDDDPADLYCGLCGLYFSSTHNKEQHLLSRRHVTRMAHQASACESALPNTGPPSDVESAESESESESEAARVPESLESVMESVCRREKEIRFLAEFGEELGRRQQRLKREMAELEARRAEAVTSQASVTSQHRQLTEQVQGLLLVPTLFGVMSRWGRDAQRAASAISVRQGQLEV